jgi:hypothetical protein
MVCRLLVADIYYTFVVDVAYCTRNAESSKPGGCLWTAHIHHHHCAAHHHMLAARAHVVATQSNPRQANDGLVQYEISTSQTTASQRISVTMTLHRVGDKKVQGLIVS